MPILLDTLVLVTVVLLWTVLVRKFPNILSKGIVKRIEHGYDKKLEELKGEIQADNSAIKSSVEFLAASQSELRVKIISSVESLWQAIGCIQEEYSDALGATALLEPHEFYKVFRGELPQIHPLVKDYKDLNFFEEKRGKIQDKVSGTEIIFVSSRLWLLYDAIFRVHGRIGLLLYQSINDKKFRDWREDELMISILTKVLSGDKIKEAQAEGLKGINDIISWLTAEFVQESSNLVRGSREVAHSVPEIYAILRSRKEDSRVQ